MIFDIILIACVIITILLGNMQVNYVTKYKKGYILATSVPYNFQNEEPVKKIIDQLKKYKSLLIKVFLVLPFLILITKTELIKMLIFVFCIMVYAILINILIYKSMYDLRKYKKMMKVGSSLKYADLNANVEIRKKSPKKILYILPFILLLPGLFFLEFKTNTSTMTLITGFLMNLVIVYFAKITIDEPNIIYSRDSKKNIEINMKNKVRFGKIILYFATLLSLIILVSIYITYKDPFNFYPLIIYTVAMTLGLIMIVLKMYHSPKDDEINLNVEEEDHYDIFGYKNENDPRLFVPSKINIGNMEVNRARPAGKVILGIMIALIIGAIAAVPFVLSPTTYHYHIDKDKISISSKIYKDTIELKDIKEIKLLDEFPKGDVIRTNGTSLTNQNYGNFSIAEIGNVRLYQYKSSKKVIQIKADKTYLFNEETDEKTEELFNEIKIKITKHSYMSARLQAVFQSL
ncbi:PH domain-containing protein [Lagierella sp.]|uniref:PH domain-containing protein n=1 Tax=Lagierella sp. TaxID=2849657 RepID=UPI002608D8D4|nr:PH domain-containing protein [Lagierella sp.]